jgi:hypothetical protein
MVSGRMDRRTVQEFMGFCYDCRVNVTEWLDYDRAMLQYIEHRSTVHHATVVKIEP